MKRFFQNFRYKMAYWMQGRYGLDELTRFAMYVGLAATFLSVFKALRFLYLPALILMGWGCYRCYSKNIVKRMKEREAFLQIRHKAKSKMSFQKRRWQDRKTYKYFKCSGCGQPLRVPKGKGKIEVTCPHCKCKSITHS